MYESNIVSPVMPDTFGWYKCLYHAHNGIGKKVGYVPQMTKNFMGGTVLDAVLMRRRPYIKWIITDYDVT